LRYRARVEINKQFQLRGVPGLVNTTYIGERRVDFWAPAYPTEYLLIAHDGQNIFDPRTATYRSTWRLAQVANRVFKKLNLPAPVIIGIFHSGSKSNPNGRGKDLTPQSSFENGVKPNLESIPQERRLEISDLTGDTYQKEIAENIIPTITNAIGHKVIPAKTAMIGSSMGGLATLYGVSKYPGLYKTGLALSTHWILGNQPLVEDLLSRLPKPSEHKIWFSRGTAGLDASYVDCQKYADEFMINMGWRLNHDLQSEIFNRASHNERAWARQLPKVLDFWLKD